MARLELEKTKTEVIRKTSASDEAIDKKIDKLREKENKRNLHRPKEEKATVQDGKKEEEPELKPGDKVRITGQNTIGDLIELNEKNAVVAFGQLITTLPRAQVERLGSNEAKKAMKSQTQSRSGLAASFSERRLTFKPEIDVRGKRMEEAISKIQEFIDEAIMFEVHQLRILHGKGHGILKETIREYLRAEPMIRSFKDEHVDFGGAGITVVNLAL